MNYDRKDWMTDDQYEAYKMLADLYGGDHHLSKVKPFGLGIQMNTHSGLDTFDFNHLTTAVLMAHDRCITFGITSSGPGRVKLVLQKRHSRGGSTFDRHPTINEAISHYRERYPVLVVKET